MAYSYNDGDLYYFMDQETFDMIPLGKDLLGVIGAVRHPQGGGEGGCL